MMNLKEWPETLRSLKTSFLLILLAFLGSVSAQAQQRFSLHTTYDGLGQPVAITYPDGSTVTYSYANEVGVADTVTYAWGVHSVIFIDAIELDASGLLQSVDLEHGQRSYRYDSLNQLLEEKLVLDGQTHYLARDLTYDDQGQLKSVTRQDPWLSGPLRFEYTEQGQLRKFSQGGQSVTYRYDALGNLTSHGAMNSAHLEVPAYQTTADTYDARNHHRDWDYDAQGRLLRDDQYAYSYDETGNLAMVRDLATRIPLATYLYDASGRRIRTTDIRAGTVTYAFRSDDGILISERIDHSDGPDQTINYIFHHGRLIGKMSWTEGIEGQRKTEIFNDYLGSPAVVIRDDETQEGYRVLHYEYAPFGQQKEAYANVGAPGYTGHEDDASGLTYMLARYYDSTSARFLSPDPARDFRLATPATLNLYQYSYNDPMNLVDPTGLQTGREWANQLSHEAFRGHNDFLGYAYLGLGGFLGTADGISKVANDHYLGKGDELSTFDYVHAGINLLEVLPVLKWSQLKNVGKVAKATSEGLEAGATTAKVTLNAARGKQAEDLVRELFDIGEKVVFDLGVKKRIPDGVTSSVISEVKNLKRLNFTNQLQDYLKIANQTGRQFRIFIRKDTVLSPVLEGLEKNGIIKITRVNGFN